MTKTLISNMQIPANWNQYIVENSTVRTALFESGIVVNTPSVEIARGGRSVIMPFLNDLTGTADLLSDSSPLAVNAVTTGQMTAVVNARGKAFSVNDLAAGYAGVDILGFINGRIAAWWERVFQTQLINTLAGVFASSSMAGSVLDISALTGGADVIGASSFIQAESLLGDRRGELTAIATHSAVVSKLEQLDLIQYIPQSVGLPLTTYRGKRIVEIDSLVPTSGVYPVYLFAGGAFGYADGEDVPENVEHFRDILAGDDIITTRRSYVLHPMGMSYTATLNAVTSPADSDYATGANWTLEVDPKLFPVVQYLVKLA